MDDRLTPQEKMTLLLLARQALEAGVRKQTIPPTDESALTPALRAEGASFVTLTMKGNLRGCIGALEPYQSLVEDVREHAIAAALEDYRFPPVRELDLPMIEIEISRLTFPLPLKYTDAEDLLSKLHPGVDGVILKDGMHRATFLPQVWQKIPEKADFLANLCHKMGVGPETWRKKKLDVLISRSRA